MVGHGGLWLGGARVRHPCTLGHHPLCLPGRGREVPGGPGATGEVPGGLLRHADAVTPAPGAGREAAGCHEEAPHTPGASGGHPSTPASAATAACCPGCAPRGRGTPTATAAIAICHAPLPLALQPSAQPTCRSYCPRRPAAGPLPRGGPALSLRDTSWTPAWGSCRPRLVPLTGCTIPARLSHAASQHLGPRVPLGGRPSPQSRLSSAVPLPPSSKEAPLPHAAPAPCAPSAAVPHWARPSLRVPPAPWASLAQVLGGLHLLPGAVTPAFLTQRPKGEQGWRGLCGHGLGGVTTALWLWPAVPASPFRDLP